MWDTRDDGRGWYHLQPETLGIPDDVLHWTGSGQNWNHMCADCHSTAVTKGFDASTNTFNTQFAEVSVGCEACHGRVAQRKPAQFPVVSLGDRKFGLPFADRATVVAAKLPKALSRATSCWITMSLRCWTRVCTLPMDRSWTRFLFTALFCKAKCTTPVSVAATVMSLILASFSAAEFGLHGLSQPCWQCAFPRFKTGSLRLS